MRPLFKSLIIIPIIVGVLLGSVGTIYFSRSKNTLATSALAAEGTCSSDALEFSKIDRVILFLKLDAPPDFSDVPDLTSPVVAKMFTGVSEYRYNPNAFNYCLHKTDIKALLIYGEPHDSFSPHDLVVRGVLSTSRNVRGDQLININYEIVSPMHMYSWPNTRQYTYHASGFIMGFIDDSFDQYMLAAMGYTRSGIREHGIYVR